jgi:hypothetical protein
MENQALTMKNALLLINVLLTSPNTMVMFLPTTSTSHLQAFGFGDYPYIQLQLQKEIHPPNCHHDSWRTVPRCCTKEAGLTVCNGLQIRTADHVSSNEDNALKLT